MDTISALDNLVAGNVDVQSSSVSATFPRPSASIPLLLDMDTSDFANYRAPRLPPLPGYTPVSPDRHQQNRILTPFLSVSSPPLQVCDLQVYDLQVRDLQVYEHI